LRRFLKYFFMIGFFWIWMKRFCKIKKFKDTWRVSPGDFQRAETSKVIRYRPRGRVKKKREEEGRKGKKREGGRKREEEGGRGRGRGRAK
jgi:hypothetical protein